jgi:hypothetical protein
MGRRFWNVGPAHVPRQTGLNDVPTPDQVLPYRAVASTSEAASEAEGQVDWACHSPQVTGRRLVSFLVSSMFVYLRPSPSTAGL